MRKALNNLVFSLFLSLVFINTAYAGEKVPSGTIITVPEQEPFSLSEDSYIFSEKEAQKLASEIKNLEELVELYKSLDSVQKEQLEEKNAIIQILEDKIVVFQDWQELDEKRIKQLSRQKAFKNIERWGFFGAGFASAIIIIIVTDQLDDQVIENN